MKLNFHISDELRKIANTISCHFVDSKLTSKQYVRDAFIRNSEYSFGNQGFNVLTCLRSEFYSFNSSFQSKDFFYVENALCLRRLLSIMVGLHSEIIGEREIFTQVEKGIDKAYSEHKLNGEYYTGCKNLLEIAQEIRTSYHIETQENYSTIGARLLREYLQTKRNNTLLIVGGGYMIESFLTSLTDTNIDNIVWANRSDKKVKKIVNNFSALKSIPKTFIPLEKVHEYSNQFNAVFAALSGGVYLEDVSFERDCFVIDVSYPPVFNKSKINHYMSLSNTYFDDYLEKKVEKANVEEANNQIKDIIYDIYRS